MYDKSTRILLFTTAFRPFIGGSELAIEEIAKRLPDINFDIITPRYTRKLTRVEAADNVRIYRVGQGWLGDKLFFPVAGFMVARQLVHKNGYQIVHAYQASHGAGAAWLLKLFNPRIKFILTLQEGKNLETQNLAVRFFRKLIIKKADAITVISSYLKDCARRINKKVRIVTISNGVDVINFSREYSYGELSGLADRLGIKPGDKVITSVSRLVPKNGVDTLIKAFSMLSHKSLQKNSAIESVSTYKLLIIGDVFIGEEEQKEKLVSLARELDVYEKIIWAGSVNHAELPGYLKISDLFVRPSQSEGLGSAFLEAMAAGVPIIGTRVGGIPDFLKDKETGVFAEINNPEDLADKIALVLNNKDLAEKLITNARNLVVEKYDWKTVAEQFKELYFGLGGVMPSSIPTKPMKLSIVIPVFNEIGTIEKLLELVENVNVGMEKEIIIVDDCSTDGTRDLLCRLENKYKIHYQPKNMGKGAAVKRGFGEVTGDIVLIQDADLEYNPQEYPNLIRPIVDGEADVVYGSRFLKSDISQKNKVIYRRGYLFSKVLNSMSNVLSGTRLSDMYTCYKVFARDAINQIHPHIESKRFGIDPELTAWVARLNFRVMEVPISYVGRTYEEGKKINWKDGLAAIWHIIRFNIFY